jgi:hypothetical protein
MAIKIVATDVIFTGVVIIVLPKFSIVGKVTPQGLGLNLNFGMERTSPEFSKFQSAI